MSANSPSRSRSKTVEPVHPADGGDDDPRLRPTAQAVGVTPTTAATRFSGLAGAPEPAAADLLGTAAARGRRSRAGRAARPATRVQAAGPAARASASVRARSSSTVSGRPPRLARPARSAGRRGSRRVARSIRVRCSRTSRSTSAVVVGANPSRREHAAGDRRAHHRVVARAGHLADVVQQGGEQQQVGTARRCEPGRWRSTTVSMRCRSTVCRCTGLRCGRHRTAAHSGIHVLDHAGEVQPLPDADQPGPGGQQVGERPRAPPAATASGSGAAVLGQVRSASSGASGTCCGPRSTAARRTSSGSPAGSRTAAEHHLAVVLEQAVAQRVQLRPPRPDPQACAPAATATARRTVPSRA